MHPTPRWRHAATLVGFAAVVGALLVPAVAAPAAADPLWILSGPTSVSPGVATEYTLQTFGGDMPAGFYCLAAAPFDGITTTTTAQTAALGTTTLIFSVTASGGGDGTLAAFPVATAGACPGNVPTGAIYLDSQAYDVASVPRWVTLSPPDQTADVASPAVYSWAVFDASFNPTALTPGYAISVTPPIGSSTVTFNGASQTSLSITAGQTGTFTVQNSLVGATSILASLIGPTSPPAIDSDYAGLTTVGIDTLTVSPPSTTASPGATTTFTLSVTGAGNTIIPGVPITVAVTGRNPRTTQLACITGLSGSCTWSLTDAPLLGNTATQDTLTFIGGGETKTATITYGSNNPVGITLATNSDPTTLITGVFTAVPASGPVYRTGTTPFSVNTGLNLTSVSPTSTSTYAFAVRVTVAGPGGAPIAGATVSLTGTVAGSQGTWVLNGTTPQATGSGVTNANGQALFRVLSTKTGNVTWAAASGGLTGTLTAAYANAASDARTVSVNPTSVTMPTATATAVTGTVSDRYGNPVSGIGMAFTAPAGSPITFTGSATGTTNASGQVAVQITSPTAGTSSVTAAASQAGSQLTDPANTVLGQSVPNVSAGVNSVTVPVTITAPPNPPTATITSPSQGSRISSGGYFNVWFTTTNVPAGTMAYLTLDGRAKAKAPVDADGNTVMTKIPAEPGAYAIRVGGGGTGPVLVTSSSVSLTIIPFRLNGYSMSNGRAVFRVATGNFSAGTKVYLTRNGIAVAAGTVNRSGQAMSITAAPTPGVYQVRVNSNQGWVYGAQQGVISLS